MLLNEIPGMNGIKTGRFVLKPESLSDHLTRSCRMVVSEGVSGILPIGRTGSATLVRCEGHDCVFMTRHQLDLKPHEPPDEAILNTIRVSSGQDRLRNIPLRNCVFHTSDTDEQFADILAFRAAETWQTQTADLPYFFPLARFHKGPRVLSFMVGYPTASNSLDEYHETFYETLEVGGVGKIPMTRAIRDCVIDPAYTSHARNVRRYTLNRPAGDLDGYSGGAVFSLIGTLGTHEIVLDGIIAMAKDDQVYIVDADALTDMLEGQWPAPA